MKSKTFLTIPHHKYSKLDTGLFCHETGVQQTDHAMSNPQY